MNPEREMHAHIFPPAPHADRDRTEPPARDDDLPAIASTEQAEWVARAHHFRHRALAAEAEVERLRAAAKPAVDYCLAETYTLDHSDLETHCIRLVVRDLGIADAELSAQRPRAEAALMRAVAAVTPCSCSAQRARADRAESNARGQQVVIEAQRAKLDAVRALAKVQAISCRVMHRADHERNWLDVLTLVGDADPAPEAATTGGA